MRRDSHIIGRRAGERAGALLAGNIERRLRRGIRRRRRRGRGLDGASSRSTRPEKAIRRSRSKRRENARCRTGHDRLRHRCGRRGRVRLQVKRRCSGHVWRSHRRSTRCAHRIVVGVPRGADALPRCIHVETPAPVGERGLQVAAGRRTHSDRRSRAGRRIAACIRSSVAGRNDISHARRDRRLHGGIHGGRVATADAHVRHRRSPAVRRHPVNAGDD